MAPSYTKGTFTFGIETEFLLDPKKPELVPQRAEPLSAFDKAAKSYNTFRGRNESCRYAMRSRKGKDLTNVRSLGEYVICADPSIDDSADPSACSPYLLSSEGAS